MNQLAGLDIRNFLMAEEISDQKGVIPEVSSYELYYQIVKIAKSLPKISNKISL